MPKLALRAALVNTSQVGKVLAHSINLVKPIAVIVGEEVRAAVDEIRHDLNLTADRFHWFADQETQKMQALHHKVLVILLKKLMPLPNSIPPTTHSVMGKDGLFYIYTSRHTGLPKAVIFTHSRWTLAYGTYWART